MDGRITASLHSKRSEPVRNFADIIAAGLESGNELAELFLERALNACVGHPLPRALADACIARLNGTHKRRRGPRTKGIEFVANRQAVCIENFIRFDSVTNSASVGGDDCPDPPAAGSPSLVASIDGIP